MVQGLLKDLTMASAGKLCKGNMNMNHDQIYITFWRDNIDGWSLKIKFVTL